MNAPIEHNPFEMVNKAISTLAEKPWIQTRRGGSTGVGYTLESLLGIHENNFQQPDLYGVEIKASRTESNSKISLVTASPKEIDGSIRCMFLDIRKSKPDFNRLFATLSCRNPARIQNIFKFVLTVNREKKRLEVNVLNTDGTKTDFSGFYTFTELEQASNKLESLCLIEADSKIISNNEFFKFRHVKNYELSSFECFLNGIESGLVTLDLRMSMKFNESGGLYVRDHGCAFRCSKSSLKRVFKLREEFTL
ncbi:MvaI/BcnI family restriction endonuclease [Vibrio alginolyticus]|uniref:MvaI/BcnI family restriction endonuclease n=1 Tax=Vibrio alginolyticus TaxID=663 RepID=UPI0006CA5F59|nr:hypothetical protein AOG25_10035 [Vibrio alginolyticus]CAH7175045.1 MvaI_BcnI domain-containing protein [Vibrio chagasii]CAH7344099.1 MvaI_BcnI domain-containing protein [Vibrio chagasii]